MSFRPHEPNGLVKYQYTRNYAEYSALLFMVNEVSLDDYAFTPAQAVIIKELLRNEVFLLLAAANLSATEGLKAHLPLLLTEYKLDKPESAKWRVARDFLAPNDFALIGGFDKRSFLAHVSVTLLRDHLEKLSDEKFAENLLEAWFKTTRSNEAPYTTKELANLQECARVLRKQYLPALEEIAKNEAALKAAGFCSANDLQVIRRQFRRILADEIHVFDCYHQAALVIAALRNPEFTYRLLRRAHTEHMSRQAECHEIFKRSLTHQLSRNDFLRTTARPYHELSENNVDPKLPIHPEQTCILAAVRKYWNDFDVYPNDLIPNKGSVKAAVLSRQPETYFAWCELYTIARAVLNYKEHDIIDKLTLQQDTKTWREVAPHLRKGAFEALLSEVDTLLNAEANTEAYNLLDAAKHARIFIDIPKTNAIYDFFSRRSAEPEKNYLDEISKKIASLTAQPKV